MKISGSQPDLIRLPSDHGHPLVGTHCFAKEAHMTDQQTEQKIVFHCPNCNSELRVRKAGTGRKGKCPICRSIIRIPNENDPSVL